LLIVDDSELIREEIKKKIISKTGYEKIYEAIDVKSAKKIIEENEVDLCIIDLALPDGSGFEVLQYIKDKQPNATTMILTNYPYEQFREKALEFGADYFFDKSKDFSVVLEIINDFIDKTKMKEIKLEKKMINILVVDDSAILRKMVIASLKEIVGANFSEASSGLEAIEQLAINKYDIVILDLNMPDIHGMEVLRFIRSHEMYKNLPVIILTTRSDDQSKEAAIEAGATVYMTKPFLANEIKNQVEKILGLKNE